MLQRTIQRRNVRSALLASLAIASGCPAVAQTTVSPTQTAASTAPLRSLLTPAPVTPTLTSPIPKASASTQGMPGTPRINRYVDLHQYDQSRPTKNGSTPSYTLAQHARGVGDVDGASQGQVRRNPLIADVPPRLRQFHVGDRQPPLSGALVVREAVIPDREIESLDEVVEALSEIHPTDTAGTLGEARSVASNGGFGMLAIDQLGSHLPADDSPPVAPKWDRERLATDLVPLPNAQVAVKATRPSDADPVADPATLSSPRTDWLNPRKGRSDFAEVIRSQTIKPGELTESSTGTARLEATALEELGPSGSSGELLVTSEMLPLLPAPRGQSDRGDVEAFSGSAAGPQTDRLFSEASGAFGLDQRVDASDNKVASTELTPEGMATPTRLLARDPQPPIEEPGATSPSLARRFSSWTKRLGANQGAAQSVSTPIEPKQTSGIFSHFLRRTDSKSGSSR